MGNKIEKRRFNHWYVVSFWYKEGEIGCRNLLILKRSHATGDWIMKLFKPTSFFFWYFRVILRLFVLDVRTWRLLRSKASHHGRNKFFLCASDRYPACIIWLYNNDPKKYYLKILSIIYLYPKNIMHIIKVPFFFKFYIDFVEICVYDNGHYVSLGVVLRQPHATS